MSSRGMCLSLGLGLLTLTGLAAGLLRADEHPEHPEHPEGRAGSGSAASLTKADLARAIAAHVKKSSVNGRYAVKDPETGKTLKLALDRVHEERLSRVGPDRYFACADFKAAGGTVYDLDFFMSGKKKESLAFSDVSIHKVDGQARYTWHEERGLWQKKPVDRENKDAGSGSSEHPEHPEHPDDSGGRSGS